MQQMAKVHDVLEMMQGSQNLSPILKESHAQNKQMTAITYIWDTEEIVKASWSLFEHDGAAAFKLSERSPFPPELSAKELPGGWTRIWNVRRIRRLNCHLVKSYDDWAPDSISDSHYWLNWYGDLDNPNDSKDDSAADVESDIEQDNGIEDPECTEQRDVNAAPNVPGPSRPIRKSKGRAELVFVMVNAI